MASVKKILFITQYFYPEEFRGNDIAFDLVQRGCDVTVLCAIPNYPKGEYFAGYGLLKKQKEIVNGVKVIRVPVVPRGKNNAILLMLNYLSFALLGSLFAFFLALKYKFDSIFVQQLSPITLALPAIVAKKIRKTPIILWVLDLWPESLTSAGGIKNKHILNFFDSIVRLVYRNSDKILISSEGFIDSIKAKGVTEDKILHYPNWAEDCFFDIEKKKLPELPEGFRILFAGNIGEAQDFNSIMDAALLLKGRKDIHFIVLGDGRKMQWLKEFVYKHELNETVHLLGRYSIDYMPSFFQNADAMLVSLKDEPIFNMTLPAKVQAYMSASKPIIGMLNGDGAHVIDKAKCGLSTEAGNVQGLVDIIIQMNQMSVHERNILGENGYEYSLKNYNKQLLMDTLFDYLNINY